MPSMKWPRTLQITSTPGSRKPERVGAVLRGQQSKGKSRGVGEGRRSAREDPLRKHVADAACHHFVVDERTGAGHVGPDVVQASTPTWLRPGPVEAGRRRSSPLRARPPHPHSAFVALVIRTLNSCGMMWWFGVLPGCAVFRPAPNATVMLPGVLSFSEALSVGPPAKESARTDTATADALRPVIADPFRAVRRENGQLRGAKRRDCGLVGEQEGRQVQYRRQINTALRPGMIGAGSSIRSSTEIEKRTRDR